MNKWLVVHDLLAYHQHPDMIGNAAKGHGDHRPRYAKFENIKKGDIVVYYARKDMAVLGIFEVVSDVGHLQNDPYWKEVVFYKIKPAILPPSGKVLDFKKLVTSPDVHFDAIPSNKRWGSYLQGRACILFTNGDYKIIESAVSRAEFLKKARTLNEHW
jgi:hypothetical protein